ncbi:MAG: TolC family protein [Clostridia bacterium]|nr:TolC family protein [Clostridia bacterium]
MRNRILMLWLMLASLLPTSMAQQSTEDTVLYFSMDSARAFAREHNYDVINALKDIEIARKQVVEIRAMGLPQISASVGYNDFIDIPTQLIPGEFFGEPAGSFIPVKFGTKYSVSAGATASMLLFSGEYIVGLQASRTFVDMSQKQYDKALIELDQNVAQSYYMVLIAERNQAIIDSTLLSLLEIRTSNEALYENGFIEDTDLDQVDLLISDLRATLLNIQNNMDVSRNLLKFQMGLQLNNQIVLTDDLNMLLDKVDQQVLMEQPFDYRRYIDFRLLETQQALAYLDMKRYKSQYLPRLSTFFNFQENAYRQQWNFFSSDQDWFKTTLWGVQLDIPIFQSGSRSARVSQSKIKIDQLQVTQQKLEAGLSIQFATVRNQFLNAWKVYQNKKESRELALKIYRKTETKQREGVSSSIELQQNYNQYLNNERDYVMAVMELLNSQLELQKLLTVTQ